MSNSNPSTRTIAFIHGAFITQHCFDHWAARFRARGYVCKQIAYPGREASVAELRSRADDGFLGKLSIEAVLDHISQELRALPEKPLVIGHSLGGLLTQLIVQRGLAKSAVAIDSVPPQGVVSLEASFLRSLWPVVNPLVTITRPYMMPFEHFRYAFVHDLAPAEQRTVYDAYVVPESRRLARGALSRAARIDFTRAHAPLLFIAGEHDHLMPPSLNRRNHARYRRSGSVADFRQFPGRAHHTILSGNGWEEVADAVLEWAIERGGLAEASLEPQAIGKGVW